MNRKFAVFSLFTVAALAVGGYWYLNGSGKIAAQSAALESRVATAAVAVTGVVKDVYVATGESVTRDQPLLALDPAGYEARLARERTLLAEIASTLPSNLLVQSPNAPRTSSGKPLSALRTEEEDARRRVEAAAHEYAAANLAFSRLNAKSSDYTKPDPARQAALISRDEAARTLQAAKDVHEKVSYARAQKEAQDKLDKMNGPIPAALAARIAEYQAQVSRVRLAEQDLAATILPAPESGKVTLVAVLPGDSVAPGDVPVAVMPETVDEVWATAFFDEPEGKSIAVGQECVVSVEGDSVKGAVARILPAPSAEDAEKRLAVRVVLDQDGLPESFAPGRSASVVVLTGKGNFLDSFLEKITKN